MTETSSTPAVATPKRGVPIWVQILVWVALLGLLAVVALGLNRVQKGAIQKGETVPDFQMVFYPGYEMAGKSEARLSDFRGKVVLINFWASWCKPCEEEAAELEAAWKAYAPGGEVVFLGIAYVDTEPKSLGYLQKFGITYPNGPDLKTQISPIFGTKGVPETFFIDRNGQLAHIQIGPFTSEAQIRAILDSMLKK